MSADSEDVAHYLCIAANILVRLKRHLKKSFLLGNCDSANLHLGTCNLLTLSSPEDFSHAPHLRAHAAQLLFHALVAAVHVVDTVQDAFAIRHQRTQH